MPIIRHGPIRVPIKALLILLVCGLLACAGFAMPLWWGIQDRELLDETQGQDNRAAVSVGQLKTAALRAKQALDEQHASSGGAGVAINDMIAGWLGSAQTDNQSVVATVGQGKTVAKLFYDRLDQLGARHASDSGHYPWVTPSDPDEHLAALSAGQLKTLFNFGLTVGGNVTLSKVAGDNQILMPEHISNEPLIVWTSSFAGEGVENCPITFELSEAALLMGAQIGVDENSMGQAPVVVQSDSIGLGLMYVKAPTSVNSAFEVMARSEIGKVIFKVFVQPYDPVLETVAGGGQLVVTGAFGTEPLVLKLKDGYSGNPLANQMVQLSHIRGYKTPLSYKLAFSLNSVGGSPQLETIQLTTDSSGECRVWLGTPGWSANFAGLEKVVASHAFSAISGEIEKVELVTEIEVGQPGPPEIVWYNMSEFGIGSTIGSGNGILSPAREPDSEYRFAVGVRKHGRWLEAKEIELSIISGHGRFWPVGTPENIGMTQYMGVTTELAASGHWAPTDEWLVSMVANAPIDHGMRSTIRAKVEVDGQMLEGNLEIETSQGSPSMSHAVGTPQVRIGRVIPNLNYSWTGPISFTGTNDTASASYVAQLGRSVSLVDDFIVAGGTTRIRSLAVNGSGDIASALRLKNSSAGSAVGVLTHGGYFSSYDQGSGNFFSAGRTSATIPAFKYDGVNLVRQSTTTLTMANGYETIRGLNATPLGFAVIQATDFILDWGHENRLETWNWGTGENAANCVKTSQTHQHETWISGYSDSNVTSFGPHFLIGRARPHLSPPWDTTINYYGLNSDLGTSYLTKFSTFYGDWTASSSLEFAGAASAIGANYLAVASVPHGMPSSSWTGDVEKSCVVTIYRMEGGLWQYHDSLRVFEPSEEFDGGNVSLAWDGDRLLVGAYAGNAWVNNVGVGCAVNGPVRNSTNGVPTKPATGKVIERFRVTSYLPLEDGKFVLEHIFRDDSKLATASGTRPASLAERQFSLAAVSGRVLLGFPTLRKLDLYEETALHIPVGAPVGTIVASVDTFDIFLEGERGYVLECDHAALSITEDSEMAGRWNVVLATGAANVAETITYIRAVAAPGTEVVVPAVLPRVPLRFSIGGSGGDMVATPGNLIATRTSTTASALSCVDESVNETAFQFQYKQDNQTTWTSLGSVTSTTQAETGATIARNHTGIGTGAIWVDYRVRAVRATGGTTYSNFSPVTRCFMKDALLEASMVDSDGDGVPNEVETTEGTSTTSASSNTLGLGLSPRTPLNEQQ
jgi:hypothetical protein